jgi:hypothetical protein
MRCILDCYLRRDRLLVNGLEVPLILLARADEVIE